MEERSSDKNTNSVISKVNVLCIGDKEESSTASKKTVANFEDDCKKHMSWLLVGSRIPIEPVEDWNTVELFGMASVKEGKKPREYHFFCGSFERPFPIGTQMTGPTCNAREVMKKLKELLSEENWVADNVIQTPLRAKIPNLYLNTDWYIQKMVSEALDFEQKRLFWYCTFVTCRRNILRNKKDKKI